MKNLVYKKGYFWWVYFIKNRGLISIKISGYLTSLSLKYIREFLIASGRIIGVISLPEGVFKKSDAESDAGGFTTILFFKKEKIETDYKIFVDVAIKIGFNHTSKNQPKIFKRDENGDFILDENNNKILDNDLIVIKDKLKKFCFDNNILGMERENLNIDYCFTNLTTFLKDDKLILCPKRYSHHYKSLISTIKSNTYATLKDINGVVENRSKDPVVKNLSKQ
uniref:DNA methylase adenine-specific domain-containing protein n=1 Tax=Pseudochlorodesmis sp. HV01306a TaxID=2358488 RepID=A0A386AXZ5_9CHLO|nr:hypothetical protein [Pseudochlorodesmis sp. HV01306a]